MASFSERLILAMKERGLSQAELSAASGIPKSAISQYVHNIMKPKQSRTALLAKTLGVSPSWLMGYDSAELTAREHLLLDAYRGDPRLRQDIDALLDARIAHVFRAAKSKSGTAAPSVEAISAEQLRELEAAPETDEDL
ncbi:MAG: helix-turn-helix domain-containing protein [Clostridia bacterium]|nr:helix-turn-helix domain-containing protein [Clostridia bacterium]MBQ2709796.1 helix-turn-helix domain-containing protein [Clostridia bacterium]